MGVAGFIYARSDSTRLPNKIFKKFGKRYLIDIVIERLRCCNLDTLYLLTSKRALDDQLAKYCEEKGIVVFRGDFEDLVLRTVQAIEVLPVKKFLRVNADSPFISPTLVNYSLNFSEDKKFISNLFDRTFPYGVALELIDCDWYCQCASLRMHDNKEHLTHHLYQNLLIEESLSITQNYDLRNYQLTIDTSEDYHRLHSVLSEQQLIEYWEFLKFPQPSFKMIENNARN